MFQNLTAGVKSIVIINIILFIINLILPNTAFYLSAYFPLSPNFKLWQVFTHIFLFNNLIMLLLFCVPFISFGPLLERVLGTRQFIVFFIVCAIIPFIVNSGFNLVHYKSLSNVLSFDEFNKVYQNSYIFTESIHELNNMQQDNGKKLFSILTKPFFGQTGAIFGFLMAFGLLCPNVTIMLLLPPIPLKAKYLIPISLAISIYFGYRDIIKGDYAQLSYLYGAIVAFIWIYFFKKKHGISEIY